MPADALAALRIAARAAVSAPETRYKLAGLGAEPQAGQADELAALMHSESTVQGEVIKDGNITLQ